MTNSKLKRKVYESKKARDILDEEFVEFGSTKRNINEFFNLYNSKFYNIIKKVHKFFAEESLQYVIDYINPKTITVKELQDQKLQLQIEIGSIEKFHPIFPNNIILSTQGGDNINYFLIQSGKKRRIIKVNGNYCVFQNRYREHSWGIAIDYNVFYKLESGGKYVIKNKHLDDEVSGYKRYSNRWFTWSNEDGYTDGIGFNKSNIINNPTIYFPGLQDSPLNSSGADHIGLSVSGDNPFNPKSGGSNFENKLASKLKMG